MSAKLLRRILCISLAAAALWSVNEANATELPLRVPGKAALSQKSLAVVASRAQADAPVNEVRLGLAQPRSARTAPAEIATKALQVGTMRDVATEADALAPSTLTWSRGTNDNGWVTRVALTSPGANALRLGIAVAAPASSELRISASGKKDILGPFSAVEASEATTEYGMFWTPVTEGESQVVELWVPDAANRARVRVEIQSASHMSAPLSTLAKAAAQGCHEDVVCVASSNAALAKASRSVAKLVFTKNGVSFMCTGTLINDGSNGQVPYIYTAAHCIDSQAVAATMNTFWSFEAAQCGGATAAPYLQLSGGATLLYADAESDVALLRLTDRAPDGAWFSGWDATEAATGANLVALHHPQGGMKKLSLGDVMPSALPQFLAAGFRVGATEPGSSGSGLFTESNGEYLLRGGLKGGSSSCTSSGNLADPSNRDYYSRFDKALPTLRKWLSSTASPAQDFTGMWSNPAEPGWGLSIVQSAEGKAFVTWYTYDESGKPAWFVIPEVAWKSAVAFEGTIYRTQGTPQGTTYDPKRFAIAASGTMRIDFGRDTATLTVSVNGQLSTKPLAKLAI